MSSSSTKPATPNSTDRPQVNRAKSALSWLAVVALAIFPFPWWW
jgi:hypothetical protein